MSMKLFFGVDRASAPFEAIVWLPGLPRACFGLETKLCSLNVLGSAWTVEQSL